MSQWIDRLTLAGLYGWRTVVQHDYRGLQGSDSTRKSQHEEQYPNENYVVASWESRQTHK